MFEQIQTFPCPNCEQFISDRAERCRFCDEPVDPVTARAAAGLQSRVNQACSDASYLKIVALSMWGALVISTGVVSVLINSAFLVMAALLPILIARWQLKFGRVETRDPDFARARRAKNLSLALWLAALVAASVVVLLLPEDAAEIFIPK